MSVQKQYAKLVMVTADNNNKFYEMTWDGGPNFTAKYGRIQSTSQTVSYPYSQWAKKYNEKVNKGYKDVTHTVAVTVEDKKVTDDKDVLQKIEDAKVEKFMSLMKKYTDGLVAKTYTVKHKDVTQAQVDEAQQIINDLHKIDAKKDVTSFNTKLLELYMIIPRYMGNVKDHLLPNIDVTKTLDQEQINLDAMASQVAMYNKDKKDKVDKKAKKETKTLLDLLGIKMKEATPGKDVQYLIKQLTGKKIESFFEVEKPAEDKMFESWMAKQKNKETRFLLHGTKCSSVIPILEQGLKIRPVGNFQFSGKVYGDGNYFSEVCSKSLNYTGYDADQVMFIFEVHTGKPFVYDGWYKGNSFTLCYNELQKRGFDSTHVNAGNGLLNSEIIAYKEEQCRVKYILWLKR